MANNFQRQSGGSPAGVSGWIGQPGTDGTGFNVVVYGFKRRAGGEMRARFGDGVEPGEASYRWVRHTKNLVLSGKAHLKAPPEPAQWRGQTKQVVLQAGRARTVTLQIIVDTFEASYKSSDDSWDITITARQTGEPVYSEDWGEQEDSGDVTKTDVRLYEGSFETHDLQGLASAAQITIDWYGVALATDEARHNRLLDAIIGTAIPATGLKKRPGTFFQDAADGGTIVLTFGLNDTKDEVLHPRNQPNIDPQGLGSNATTADINSPAPTPTGAAFKLRERSTVKLNDGKTLNTAAWALTDQKEDVENQGTVYQLDESELTSSAQITIVEADSSPDGGVTVGGLVLRGVSKRELNDAKWEITYHFGERTSEEDEEFPGTLTLADPSALVDSATITLVNDSSTAPVALSTPPSGLKHRGTNSTQLTNSGKWKHRAEYGRRSNEDDVEMGGTLYVVDDSNLKSTASISVVEADASPDGGVSVSGLILSHTTKKQLHDSKWEITYHFAELTSEQAVEFPGTITSNDPSNLLDKATVTLVNDSSTYPVGLDTPPSGLKLREVDTEQLTDSGRWRHTGNYGRRSTEDDEEMGGSVRRDDQSATHVVAGEARISIVESDSTPDGGISYAPLVLRDVEKKQLNDDKWLITYIFGQRTHEQDILFEGTETEDDPSGLASRARVTLVNASSTYPVALDTPPTVSDGTLKLRRIISRRHTNGGKWIHAGLYAYTTEEDEIEMGGSSITDCQSDIADAQITVVVTNTSATSNPGTPSGLKFREVISRQLNDDRWRHEYRYTRTNREDDIEFDATSTILDAEALESGGTIAVINTSASPPVTPAAPATDTKLISTTTKQIHGAATPKYVHIFKYGVRTTQEEVEWLQSDAVAEAGHLDRTSITVEVTSSSTPGSGTNPDSTNLSLYRTSTKRLTDTQYVHVFTWRPLTATERMDADHSVTVVDPGAIPLGTRQTECVIDGNSTAPSAPAVSGLVCFEQKTTRVGKVKYQHVYHYRYRSNEDELIADKTITSTDASALESSAVTADVWLVSGGGPADPSAPGSPTGLQLVSKQDSEVPNPLYRLRVYRWGLVTNEERIEFGDSVVTDDPFKLKTQRRASIEASSSAVDLATFAAAARTTYQGDRTYGGVTARQLTPAKKLLLREVVDDSKLVIGEISARPVLLGNVGTLVRVVAVRSRGTNGSQVWLGEIEWWRSTGIIEVHRRLTVNTDINETLLHAADVTKRNSTQLLGIGAGYLVYVGAEWIYSGGYSDTRPISIKYKLAFDSLQFQGRIPTGEYFTTQQNVATGDHVVGTLLGINVNFLTQADLSFIWQ